MNLVQSSLQRLLARTNTAQIEVKSAGTTGVPARHVLFFPRSTTDYTIDVEKPYHCDIDRYAFFPPLFR